MSLAHRLYMGDAGLNIVGHRKRWYVVTAVLMVICIGSFLIRGFNFGIEFSGGNSFQVPAANGLTLERAEQIVVETGSEVVSVQRVGSSSGQDEQYLIRTAPLDQAVSTGIKSALAEAAGVAAADVSDNRVSASWGGQITQKALVALLVFLALVVAYLAVRFEWRMAVGAIGALVHDLMIAAGIYSLVGFEVTPSTVIGLLTILGFSLYDTVVVFDKVQENTRGILGGSRHTYGEAANLAINQTLMRSINTSVIALLPVGGLLFIGAGLLGAGTLKDLGLVLFVGMAAGTYSSVFLATPILVDIKEREPRYAALRKRIIARRLSGEDATRKRPGRGRTGGSKPADSPGQGADRAASRAVGRQAKVAGRTTVVLDKPEEDELDVGENRDDMVDQAKIDDETSEVETDETAIGEVTADGAARAAGAGSAGAPSGSGQRQAARTAQRRRQPGKGGRPGGKRKR